MTSINVIENKISSIRRYLAILASYQSLSLEQLSSDVTVRGAVERYLYLLAQAAIELAEAVIAFRNLRKPATLGEGFSILYDAGILPQRLRDNLTKMAGFRNILAHDYERLDYGIVYDVLQNRLGDVEEWAAIVSHLAR